MQLSKATTSIPSSDRSTVSIMKDIGFEHVSMNECKGCRLSDEYSKGMTPTVPNYF